jgi:hypothetical protein
MGRIRVKKRDPKVFYPYDEIRIINPQVFVRCGYPLSKKMIKETFTDEQRDAVIDMFRKTGVYMSSATLVEVFTSKSDPERAYDKVMDIIAGELLAQKGWGGKDRTIHTIERPELLNATGWVSTKRVVKTGKYRAGGGSYDYYGDMDYDPPYLDDEKTHIILTINVREPVLDMIEIEACHVEKVGVVKDELKEII